MSLAFPNKSLIPIHICLSLILVTMLINLGFLTFVSLKWHNKLSIDSLNYTLIVPRKMIRFRNRTEHLIINDKFQNKNV